RDKQGDLKQQVALATASVLQCADDAVTKGGLDRQTLKLYLNGCATFSEANVADMDWRSLSRLFRGVVEKAPAFDGAWGKLLLSESYVIASQRLPETSPEVKQLREDLIILEKQGRDLPESYWGRLILLPGDSLAQGANIVEQGSARHPDSADMQSFYAGVLLSLGRMKEAVAAQKRATELDPL